MAEVACPLCSTPMKPGIVGRVGCIQCGLAGMPAVIERIRRMQMGWDNAVRVAGQYLVGGTHEMLRAEQAELRIRELTAQNVELKKDSDCWLGKLEKAERELAQLKQPAHVLAEAERLLREAGVLDPLLRDGYVFMVSRIAGTTASGGYVREPSLAEAYAKLTGGRDG